MNEQKLEKLNKDFFGYTMAQIDEDLGRYMMKYSDLLKEKQDLIKYLEDKIEENENKYKEKLLSNNYLTLDKTEEKINTYQEILDKIKEGNYE